MVSSRHSRAKAKRTWTKKDRCASQEQSNRARSDFRIRYQRALVLAIGCVVLLGYYAYPHSVTEPIPVWNWRATIHDRESYDFYSRPGYLLLSEQCVVKDMNPFSAPMTKLMHPFQPIKCSQKQLTYIESSFRENRHVLRVNYTEAASLVAPGNIITCCYSNISLTNTPFSRHLGHYFHESACLPFEEQAVLMNNEEFVTVRCFNVTNTSKTVEDDFLKAKFEVYKNVHAFVPVKNYVAEKLSNISSNFSQMNVLMIAYDSISRLNLLRTMPKTVKFLERSGFVDFFGYNAIANSSFLSAMAILTGMNSSEVRDLCRSKYNYLDNCSFIWSDLNKNGYVTAFIEDDPNFGLFNSNGSGFAKSPTDYYFRPYMLAAHHLFGAKLDSLRECLGPLSPTAHIMKYTINFVKTFPHSPFFALLWLKNLSQNIDQPKAIDADTLEFFLELHSSRVFQNTLVVFFSDKGIHSGDLETNIQGWFEERMPFLYIFAPDSALLQYPEKIENLISNKRTLITPYDIHVTLKNILENTSSITWSNNKNVYAYKAGKSIFSGKIVDRSCSDVGIRADLCVCTEYKSVSTKSPIIQNATNFVVNEIQRKLTLRTEPFQCVPIFLTNIIKSTLIIPFGKQETPTDDYIIQFEIGPHSAIFESTVRYNESSSGTVNEYVILGSVYRLNPGRLESICVDDEEIQLYCVCL